MLRHFFGLAACVLCCAQAAGQTGTGGIRGTILDASTQKPLPVAWVVANRDGVPPFSRNTKSGGDGAFEMRGLTPGNYSICVQAEGDRYLDSCHWRGQSAAVTVAKDAITSGVAVKVAVASVVNIEVRDPQKLFGQAIAGGRKPGLNVGVWSANGLFYPARHFATPGSAAGTSQSYRLAVPRDTSLTLHIFSRDLRLGDSTGAVLPIDGKREAFQNSTGDRNPKSFTFTLLGVLP